MFRIVTAFAIFVAAATVSSRPIQAQEGSISERMLYHRAVEAVVWAMPMMNFKKFRDALAEVGVGPNDIGYFSEVQDWKF